ncbi:hypothetical protein [Methylobacterium segetis]|uniref:hypothetical protein n=1 Tax=Methylobacterium segetis TaxID=2488750 RepID=UPI00104D8EE3|nr:hypothetical protein [Methylobacterium segetis]
MTNISSPDGDQSKAAPLTPGPTVSNEKPPASSPDLPEPPLDINAGIPDPLKSDIVPGDRPADMPPPDK